MIKSLRSLSLLMITLMIAAVPLCLAEEITLTTIMPGGGGDILRIDEGVVGENFNDPGHINYVPDTNIPDNGLVIEGKLAIGTPWQGRELLTAYSSDTRVDAILKLTHETLSTNFRKAGIEIYTNNDFPIHAEKRGSIYSRKFPADFFLESFNGQDIVFVTNTGTATQSAPETDYITGEVMRIRNDGTVGIGTGHPNLTGVLNSRLVIDGDDTPDYRGESGYTVSISGDLYVDGNVETSTGMCADYVFEPTYELQTIEEHARFMWDKKHLPAIPVAEKTEDGKYRISMGAQQTAILEELEKAHIYIEQLNTRIKTLEAKLQTSKK